MSTSDEPAPKRRGRPTKPAAERKSDNFKFRARSDIRARLEASAAEQRRSISEEIEARLQRSFWEEEHGRTDALITLSGSVASSILLREACVLMYHVAKQFEHEWEQSEAAKIAIAAALQAFFSARLAPLNNHPEEEVKRLQQYGHDLAARVMFVPPPFQSPPMNTKDQK